MKYVYALLLFATLGCVKGFSQPDYYDVASGTGNGYRFFGGDWYKISAGGGTEYTYGPVTDFSIKTSMSPSSGWPNRGWTWGEYGAVPIAAIGVQGNFQLAGTFSPNKIGIGTTSPVGKLQVNINSANTAYASLTTSDIGISLSNSSNTNGNLNVMSFLDAAGNGVAHVGIAVSSQTNHTGKLFFSTRATGGNVTQRMIIDESGNVGIGTGSPDQPLTVNGTVHATRVKVETTVPGPDYVFEKDYSLPSLDEVKSYIDENKHLPEIPSAKEMEAKGIDVGEMNMLLLKKVEELTLYVIEQQKQLDDLKRLVKKQ